MDDLLVTLAESMPMVILLLWWLKLERQDHQERIQYYRLKEQKFLERLFGKAPQDEV